MSDEITVGLQDEILADLTIELDGEPTFSSSKLQAKIKAAIREVRMARKYPPDYTEEMISSDLDGYYSNIRNIALYDYNKMGAEGEESHNENGVNRSYVDRQKLFVGIVPISRV